MNSPGTDAWAMVRTMITIPRIMITKPIPTRAHQGKSVQIPSIKASPRTRARAKCAGQHYRSPDAKIERNQNLYPLFSPRDLATDTMHSFDALRSTCESVEAGSVAPRPRKWPDESTD